jgi:hypothetical protein
MPRTQHDGYTNNGFAYAEALSLTTSYSYNELTKAAQGDGSQGLKFDSTIKSVLLELAAMATDGTGPQQAEFYFSRNAAGTLPISQIFVATIWKAGGALAATGCVDQEVDVEYHAISRDGVTYDADDPGDSVWLAIRLDQGTATATRAYGNWRAK